MGDPVTEDRVKVIVAEAITAARLVGREFCITRHKEVDNLKADLEQQKKDSAEDVKVVHQRVSKVDARLWGLVLLGIAQLVAILWK